MKNQFRSPYTPLATVLLFVLAMPAYGYIDPGTGSYVIQMLIAGLVGLAFGFKSIVNTVRTSLARVVVRRRDRSGPDER